MGIGERAGLAAAMLWAFSSLLYAETKLTAWGMNFAKITIAVVVLLVQLLALSAWHDKPVLTASLDAWGWLAVSGLIGLTIGDTFYFRSLQILGARRCLVVTTTAPVFAAIVGWLFLAEILSSTAILGIAVTLAGIMWVILDGDGQAEEPGHYPGSQRMGIAFGVLFSVCQAIGGAAGKKAMEAVSALEATFIRMLLAGLFAMVVIAGRRELVQTVKQVCDPALLKKFMPAVLCGTWLGVWLSQIAFKEAQNIAVAQTLLATCPLFAIPLVRWHYGTRVTFAAVTGCLVAIGGICLIALPTSDQLGDEPATGDKAAAQSNASYGSISNTASISQIAPAGSEAMPTAALAPTPFSSPNRSLNN